MANKRMFSLDVVDTDRFLEMPTSSQALYFQLGMRADDDGFVASPRKIVKIANCGNDDLSILISKGYIIPFESGIVVVTHWGVNNNKIKGDRYKETIYTNEKSMIQQRNGVYYLRDFQEKSECIQDGSKEIPECIQDGSSMEPQNRIDKINNNICTPNTVVQVSNDEKIQDQEAELNQKSELEVQKEDFEIIYSHYPKKAGKTRAFSHYRNWLKGRKVNGETVRLSNRQMDIAVQNYVMQQEESGTEINFYKNFDTLMGNQLLDYLVEE